jgi:uncharacterized membrane protein
MQALVLLLIVVALLVLVAIGRARRTARGPESRWMAAHDVTVLRVAIDARAGRYLADQRARIGASSLAEVAIVLRRLREAWVYGGGRTHAIGPGGAYVSFEAAVSEARRRFAADGAEADEGLILATLVIATRFELFTLPAITDGEQLRSALEGLSNLGDDGVVASEIIWHPAVSATALEARYPELIHLDTAIGSLLYCDHCGAPYLDELVSCPHCGAAAADAA